MISSVCATNPTASAIWVSLTSGPFVSMSMAIRSDTLRTLSTIICAPSSDACAELIRTTFIPFSYNCLMNPSSHLLSAIVQMIFVFFSNISILFSKYKCSNFQPKLCYNHGTIPILFMYCSCIVREEKKISSFLFALHSLFLQLQGCQDRKCCLILPQEC